MDYRRRLVDNVLDDLFPELTAIALEGAKGVGKTATASRRAASTVSLASPGQLRIVQADDEFITSLPQPVFVDEWQLHPPVWDRVRRAVDDHEVDGGILLAGSAGVAPGVRIHSGAGRIVSLRMRPLSLAERGFENPAVSLQNLMNGVGGRLVGESSLSLVDYVDEILRSGLPGIRDLSVRAREVQLDSYISRIVERELSENGLHVRRPSTLRAWLAAYAAALSTSTSYVKLLDAATADHEHKPSRTTVQAYREQLLRLFILDPIPAWIPVFNPLKRLTKSAKHHLVDPALAARLVGVGKAGLLAGEGDQAAASTGGWLGALFESLAAQSVRVYAEVNGAQVGHLRTRDTNQEIDLIVEGQDRKVVAIEVKLASAVQDHDVRHLNWLHEQISDRLADKVVLTSGRYAYRRPDGVAVVPLALLGP